jgi:hypothetical protein
MTRITLPPCPLLIPPAPIARSRAARVAVVSSRDRVGTSFAWFVDARTSYYVPAPDAAADVCDQIGGVA